MSRCFSCVLIFPLLGLSFCNVEPYTTEVIELPREHHDGYKTQDPKSHKSPTKNPTTWRYLTPSQSEICPPNDTIEVTYGQHRWFKDKEMRRRKRHNLDHGPRKTRLKSNCPMAMLVLPQCPQGNSNEEDGVKWNANMRRCVDSKTRQTTAYYPDPSRSIIDTYQLRYIIPDSESTTTRDESVTNLYEIPKARNLESRQDSSYDDELPVDSSLEESSPLAIAAQEDVFNTDSTQLLGPSIFDLTPSYSISTDDSISNTFSNLFDTGETTTPTTTSTTDTTTSTDTTSTTSTDTTSTTSSTTTSTTTSTTPSTNSKKTITPTPYAPYTTPYLHQITEIYTPHPYRGWIDHRVLSHNYVPWPPVIYDTSPVNWLGNGFFSKFNAILNNRYFALR